MTTAKRASKRDLHAEITDRIIEQLEGAQAGDFELPWVRMTSTGIPTNAATGREYRGINILNLWLAQGGSNKWGTFKQWKSLGASVRKGERASQVVFYKQVTIKRDDDESDDDQPRKSFPMMRFSSVFNAEQVDGYEDPEIDDSEAPDVAEQIAELDAFVAGTGAEITWNGSSAHYDPQRDRIGMPKRSLFKSTEGFYSTEFHELAHWSGHSSRLDRADGMRSRFGGSAYAAEELVAELGAAFLCASKGIAAEPREDHARYIANWITLLRDDKKAIFTASARASDAVDYLEGNR